MTKIYPFQSKPTTWYNYSNYLNWTYEKIQAWEDYLHYFSPDFNILNESMKVLEVNSLSTITNPAIVPHPERKYTILFDNEESKEVYCYFPSELNFREGYLNIYHESYLCYFTPPEQKEVEISEEDWNALIENESIVKFPISRVIFANKWRHNGAQLPQNPEGFNKENYIIISKPSSVWYTISPKNNRIEFDYKKNAIETIGGLVLFSLTLSSVRYILNPQYSSWNVGQKTMSLYSAIWKNSINFDKTSVIYHKKGGLWVGSYPLMHRLALKNGDIYEDLIMDEIFTETLVNHLNHPTAVYYITSTNVPENLESAIHIDLC